MSSECPSFPTFNYDAATNSCNQNPGYVQARTSSGCAKGDYISQDACKMTAKLKTDLDTCQAALANSKSDDEDNESMNNTTLALSIVFGILFVVAAVLLGVLLPMAKKGKL